ncbi:MAG: serine/threonine protein kinase [Myxococcales bacterium]|nr:serine/threonine protein kinase [Myxococcales bacterium]
MRTDPGDAPTSPSASTVRLAPAGGLVLADTAVPEGAAPAQDGGEPAVIGRYAVTRRLGAGAMGAVYAAYDEALDREVAVKLMHRDDDHPRRDERLLREAQAMAKLSHPNVAQVYEAGLHGGHVYIAMELIDGVTLRRWLDAAERPWQAIVATFVAAGRGLQAAHRAGVVHRDFKPDNVLVGADGRVVVVDFGVARRSRPLRLAHGSGSSSDGGALQLADSADGLVVGTPAYMSPEQWLGGQVDARSDQFSLCAALHEALHRARAFAGDAAVELARNVLSGTRAPPPRPRRAPRWLDRPIARGLHVLPERRFPDMDALLAELTRDRARRRRRWLAAVAGLTLAGGLGFAASTLRQGDPCAAAGERVRAAWSPERRAAIAGSLADRADYAAETWSRVDARLDAYADAWARGARDACAATRVRGEASEELLDLRTTCLGARLRAFEAVVAGFERDREALDRAVEALAELPPVEPCADADYVRARVAPPADPAVAAAVEQVRERLAAIASGSDVRDPQRVVDELLAREPEIAALAYPPVLAEARALRGEHMLRVADPAAVEVLIRAYRDAGAIGHDELALEAALDVARAVEPELAAAWLTVAEALLDRLRAGDDARARFHYVRLYSVCKDGRCDDDIRPLQDAIERHRRGAGDDHPQLAGLYIGLANIHMLRGEQAAAEQAYVDALARLEALLGPRHPRLDRCLGNLARLALDRSDLATAAAYIDRTRDVLTVYSPAHPSVLGLRRLESDLADRAGDLTAAVDILARADAAAGPARTAPRDALRLRLAALRRLLGRRGEALAGLRQSGMLDAPESTPLEAAALAILLALEQGDLAAARSMHAAVAPLAGTGRGYTAGLLDLADARLSAAAGDAPRAVALLEAVMTRELPSGLRGEAAAALALLTPDPDHAHALAAAAALAFREAGPDHRVLHDEFTAAFGKKFPARGSIKSSSNPAAAPPRR